MKPNELFQIVHEFDVMWNDKRLSIETKSQLANEWLGAIPPLKLLRNSTATYSAIFEIIGSTVNGAINASTKTSRSAKSSNGKDESAATKVSGMDGREHAPSSNKADETGGRTEMGKTSKTSSGNKKRSTSRSH